MLGKVLVLEFGDGHSIIAEVLSADVAEDHLLYRVRALLAIGPPEYAAVKPGVVASAKLSELTRVASAPG